ncbi:armadillo-like helical domain-containing protein 4 isoform X2 [Rana temporaria]|uniref:armadillo-like helical domain-containing protein 4 isoform X2 n=1 Tax=Rana temporaria TaxID=8407 RepID=UPI001AAC93CF|nr:armadillo-like helical domain-containing protein 4 isoform X2 [Rana temporaria]
MKKSLVFHVCGLLCSILLVSPKASCFSLQMLKKRDIQDGNGELVGMGVPESLPGGSLLPTPSTILKDVNVSVILPNVVPIVPEEIQNSSGLLNTSNVNTYPEANNVSVANEAGPSSENGLLTTLGSSTDYPTGVTSLGIPSQGDPKGPSQLPDEKSVNLDQSSLDNSSQVNTIEMLTTNPRTSIFKTEDNQPTTSSPLIGQMITFVNAITSESPTGLGTSTLDNQNNDSLSSTMSQINEEWDDTKGTTQRSDTASSDGITPSPDQVLENESSKTAVFTIHSGVTVPSDDKSVFSTDEKTTEEKLMETDVSPGPDTEDFPTPLPSTAIDGAQAQDFPVYTDVKQPNMDISENTNVTVAPAITMDVSSQETIREPGMIDKAEETAKESTAPQVVIPRNESATASPTTTQALPIEMPSTQSTLNGSLAKDEDDLAGSVSSVVLKAPAETESSTVTAATSVPQASMMAPPARRITATPAFGSDRLESDEGDEEEDEDDEDDEADEDEEDEEDEKDNDSVDDSAERDSDLPLFTLPGLSSQEPLEDDSNVALIEGAAYQVPDTMEWEQQNQGLVRSWMEKLKDKAGYMSGMLVPVGVGIAGALLILGALYSIKIMNRRRRNGFKRHKRKQREFNSMQDRVMLLADSSEDEF